MTNLLVVQLRQLRRLLRRGRLDGAFRHPSTRALLLGGLGVALLGGGLMAAVTDSVAITGGSALSDDFVSDPEGTLEIEIATVLGVGDGADPCSEAGGAIFQSTDSVSVNQSPSGPLEIARYYTDPAWAQLNTPRSENGRYCVRNAGDVPASVEIELLYWDSREAGDCTATEAAVDATCLDGEQGELGYNNLVQVVVVTGSGDHCKGSTGTFRRADFFPGTEEGDSKNYAGLVLLPGEACVINLSVGGSGAAVADDSVWQQVLTDTASYDIAVNLVGTL